MVMTWQDQSREVTDLGKMGVFFRHSFGCVLVMRHGMLGMVSERGVMVWNSMFYFFNGVVGLLCG